MLNMDGGSISVHGGVPPWLRPAALERAERNRRAHERLALHELDWLRAIRLKFGPSVSLIDLSAGGALVESPAPLRPGSTAALTITGRGVTETATFRVLRCEVASLSRGLVYRGACLFERTLSMPDLLRPASRPALDSPSTGQPQDAGQVFARLDALLQVIRSEAERYKGSKLGPPLAQLVADIYNALDRGEEPDAVLAFVEQRLAQGIKTEAPRAVARPAVSASAAPEAPPPAARPAPAAQAVHHSAPAAPAAGPRAEARRSAAPAEADAPAGWNKLVVRFLDGRLLKGFSQDFHISRAHFHVAPSHDAAGGKPVLVAVAELKAVFFVRDFSGNAEYVGQDSPEEPRGGRRIEVTFTDNEVLVGTTLNYRPGGQNFFITPLDPGGNNIRVLVPGGSVRSVRYL